MADAVDMAVAIEAEHLARGLAVVTATIPEGVSGECVQCEWWMPRLVEGRCAFCRDGRRRPDDWEPPTPPTPTTTIPNRETISMPAKTIQLPANAAAAIAAVEDRARLDGLSLGAAAAELIALGVAALTSASPVSSPAPLDLDALLVRVRELFEQRPDQSAELAAAIARAEAAEARATEADAKINQMRAIFA